MYSRERINPAITIKNVKKGRSQQERVGLLVYTAVFTLNDSLYFLFNY